MIRFATATSPDYKPAWFHETIANALDGVLRHARGEPGGIRRLAISMPPQHGKSELVSRLFPALALGVDPNLRIIATSYNAELAGFNAAAVRKQLAAPRYRHLFPQLRLAENDDVAERLAIDRANYFEVPGHRGYYLSAGIMGSLTGFGFDIGLIDDPIKNEDEADSEAYKRRLRNAWHGTFESRERGPHSAIVMVFTRWREDDLMGYVESLAGGDWTILAFPAIQDLDDEKRPTYDPREFGEGLWLERYGQAYYEAKRRTTPARTWSGLYQQRPSPGEGALFRRDWFRFFRWRDLPDRFDLVFQCWDLGFKKTGRSWVVGFVVGVAGADFYILDRYREHTDYPGSRDALEAMSKKWPEAYTKCVEDKANGSAVMDDLRSKLGGFVPLPANDSKIARASAASPTFRGGNVYLPRDAPWAEEVIEEFVAFPLGKHDDQVDAGSHAVNWYHRDGGEWLSGLVKE